MNEKVLNNNKNGMLVLLLVILGYAAGIAGVVFMAAFGYFLGWLFVPIMAVLVLWLALGWILLCGLNFTSLKMALIIVFLWLASPVSSHLISRLEVVTNEHLQEHCQLPGEDWEDELC